MDMNEEYRLTPYETREILFYKTDNGEVRVEILLYQENLWLTQAKMAELFEVQKAAISKHLKNIFTSGELQEEAVVSKMETTAADGKRYNTSYYNLDAIIAVGYRVNSKKATMFRIWANRVLKEFIIKGYVMDDARLREPENLFGKDYFEEQLERIRDIRSSERRFYQKITDIYSVFCRTEHIRVISTVLWQISKKTANKQNKSGNPTVTDGTVTSANCI